MSKKYHEIEAFYKMEWRKLLRKFYVLKQMSSYEIAERISFDTGIDYTYRAVELWLAKLGFIRTHEKALRNRVLTGRMDYSRRKYVYSERYIDYYSRDKERGYLWAIGLRNLLKNKGDTVRLAKALGCCLKSASSWKNLRQRVTPEYQGRICAYFGVEKEKIFSEIKTFDVEKMKGGKVTNMKVVLRNMGYRKVTHLRELMYKKRVTINELGDKMNLPRTSISRWLTKKHLVSPVNQQRIANILKISPDKIFT